MISQWLAVISEYTGNLDSGAGLGQVRLEGGQSPGPAVSSEGRLGLQQGPWRSHVGEFLPQSSPDVSPMAWSTVPSLQSRCLQEELILDISKKARIKSTYHKFLLSEAD